MWRIFTVTAIIFFIPGCILGTISPVVVRLTLQSLNKAGNVIGKIYAFSTLGAIIGTFATGFLLISWMGTRNIIFAMGVILIVTALLSGGSLQEEKPRRSLRRHLRRFPRAALHLGLTSPPESDGPISTRRATTIRSSSRRHTACRRADSPPGACTRPSHPFIREPRQPLHIEYEYERIYAEVLKWLYEAQRRLQDPLHRGRGIHLSPLHGDILSEGAHRGRRDRPGGDERRLPNYLGLPDEHEDQDLQHGRALVRDELQGEVRRDIHRRLQRPLHPLPPDHEGVRGAAQGDPQRRRHSHVQHHRQFSKRRFSPLVHTHPAGGVRREKRLSSLGESRLREPPDQHLHRDSVKGEAST